MYHAIIFDFDGVIVDSNTAKANILEEIFRDHGSSIAQKIFKRAIEMGGVPRQEKFRIISQEFFGKRLPDSELKKLCDRYAKRSEEVTIQSKIFDGMLELIKKLSEDYTLYIVSGTPMDELQKICKKKNITEYFKEIYGSPESKIHWIQHILKKEKVDPEEIVFIGDSQYDIVSSKTCGIHFILKVNPEKQELAQQFHGRKFSKTSELVNLLADN